MSVQSPAPAPVPAAQQAPSPSVESSGTGTYVHRAFTAAVALGFCADVLYEHPGLREVAAALTGVVGAVAGVLALVRRR